MARTGRRAGSSGAREQILRAARQQFASQGYDGASIRAIAAAANVDPALVRHYFGNKEHLFIQVVGLPADPADFVPQLLAQGVDGLGVRLASLFLEVWDRPDGPFVALLRSVTTNDQAATMLREFVTRVVLEPLAATLELDQPQLRAALAGSQLVGLAMMRYVVKVEPIGSMPRDELARFVGPVLQDYFSRPIDS